MLRIWSSIKLNLIVLLLVVGCTAEPMQQGQFACEDNSDCPPGWLCASDGLCYSQRNENTDTDTNNTDTNTDTEIET